MIIKENIAHYEKEKYEEEIQVIVVTVVNIKMKNYRIVVAGLYCPPKHSIKRTQFLELLKNWGIGL